MTFFKLDTCIIHPNISDDIDIVVPSKMAADGHFVKKFKKKKLRIDLKWPEMRSKVIFGHPKWPSAAAILSKYY